MLTFSWFLFANIYMVRAMADLAPGLSLQGRGNRGNRRDRGERALWSAVVQQALDDLDGEPFGSLIHNAAMAYFLGGGE